MQYLDESVHKAGRTVVEALRREEGAGGVIALDNQGNGECCTPVETTTTAYPQDSGNAAELSWYVPRAGTRGWGT